MKDGASRLSGTVKTVSDSSVFGKVVVIEHDNGLETEYEASEKLAWKSAMKLPRAMSSASPAKRK